MHFFERLLDAGRFFLNQEIDKKCEGLTRGLQLNLFQQLVAFSSVNAILQSH